MISQDVALTVSLLAAAALFPLGVVFFRTFFLAYLFAFIPLYNIALDGFVYMTRVREIPDALSVAKDVVWVYVLLCFGGWLIANRRRLPVPRGVAFVGALFLAWMIVEWLRAAFTLEAFQSLLAARNSLAYVPTVLVPIALLRTEQDLERLLDGFGVVVWASGLYAIPQVLGWTHGRNYLMTERPELRMTIQSFFSDYNIFAYYAAAAFAVLVAGNRRGAPTFRLLTLVIAAVGVLASQSRGGLLAFGAGLLFMVAIGRYQGSWRRLGGVLLGTVAGAAILFMIRPELVASHRILPGWLGEPGRGSVFEDPRLVEAWPALLGTVRESPIVGQGLGVFGFAALTQAMRAGLVEGPLGVDNFYLTLLLNTGVIGLAAFLAFVYLLFRHGVRNARKRSGAVGPASAGFLGALVVLLTSGMTTNLLESFPISVHFWFFVGVVCALGRISPRSQDETPRPRPGA